MDRIRASIQIFGIVQGVGFRPFLHRTMEQYSLSGWIRNTCEGVDIEAEGKESEIDSFLCALENEAPPLANIERIAVERFTDLNCTKGISILPSRSTQHRTTLISPDIATCPDCLCELNNVRDRRYLFPFINCTNCGPRFTIIRDLPYDRKCTSMADFPMCAKCSEEYGDIRNRRYHAQPDCCSVCGPELFFLDSCGMRISGDPLSLAAAEIRRGGIVAIKGLGGMHLACRCDTAGVVMSLRCRKHRDEKPLAVMCADMEAVRRLCMVSADEEELLTSPARPIVLLRKKDASALPHLSENRELGVMLPYTPVHHLLLQMLGEPLVMTSANLSDLPILIENNEAVACLSGIADGFLLHNRSIENRCDDSLFRVVNSKPYPLRRSRGYAPLPLHAAGCSGGTLACGAEQKASFALSRGAQVFPSAHIGDLKNAETLQHYENQIRLFRKLFDVNVQRIACDMHPDYLSSEYARRKAASEGLPLVQVQHHHAHMAACMLDNGLEGDCIGIIWDGTGYGSDGSIWGGEFLIGGYAGVRRAGSIRPIRLPGGDKAVHEIYRIAVSLLWDAGIPVPFTFDNSERLCSMLTADVNCPSSSGMGRLFDGVCALVGIRHSASYEGQGAVLLESAADESCDENYNYSIEENEIYIFDYRWMISEIHRDLLAGVSAGLIAARFMNTLVAMGRDICARIRRDSGLKRIVLSGGVFQNMYLLHGLSKALEEDGFEVFRHSRVSTNDEGISFGQIAIAERSCKPDVPCSTVENYRS